MVMSSLLMAGALFASSRFGPADIVAVERIGPAVRITAYGDTHLVQIQTQDGELRACRETLRQSPATCTFAHGGSISLVPRSTGTRMEIADTQHVNIVDFVLDKEALERARRALSQ